MKTEDIDFRLKFFAISSNEGEYSFFFIKAVMNLKKANSFLLRRQGSILHVDDYTKLSKCQVVKGGDMSLDFPTQFLE